MYTQIERWLRRQLGEQKLEDIDSSGQRTAKVLHLRYLGNPAASGHRQVCITVTDSGLGTAALQALWQLWVPVSEELSRPGEDRWRYCKCRWMY